MNTPTPQEVDTLRQQGKTFQEIADIYGCSKQYIHQIACGKTKVKMKAPSKAELYAQIDALTRENIAMQERLDAEERERWNKLKDKALEVFYKKVPFFSSEMYFVQLDHIDKAGYWFTFELWNDSTKQTYCVRHTDL